MTLEVELSMNIYSSQLFSFNAYFFNTIYKEMTTFNGNRFQFRISNLFKHYAGSFYRVFNFIFLYNTLFLWQKTSPLLFYYVFLEIFLQSFFLLVHEEPKMFTLCFPSMLFIFHYAFFNFYYSITYHITYM